jgi:hypothetical protein
MLYGNGIAARPARVKQINHLTWFLAARARDANAWART